MLVVNLFGNARGTNKKEQKKKKTKGQQQKCRRKDINLNICNLKIEVPFLISDIIGAEVQTYFNLCIIH